jgi:hypothetical protein
MLRVDKGHLQQAIVTLGTAIPGTVRGIQTCLGIILKTHRSTGFISETLQQAGEGASQENAQLTPPSPILGEADEIFQRRKPCLTVVDGHSFLALSLAPERSRDATTWGVTLLTMAERGVTFHNLVADGAKGITAGVEEAKLAIPLIPDRFHLLQEGHRLGRRLETAAYRAIETAERARRAEAEALTPKRRRGRRLVVKVGRHEAEEEENKAILHYDLFCWLFDEVCQALEPYTSLGLITSPHQARQTVETATSLLMLLDHAEVRALAQSIQARLDDLLTPLIGLGESLSPWRQRLDPQMEAAIVWAWRHRHELGLQEAGEGFPPELRPTVVVFWQALELFHRASSLAESLHSWLRPYFQAHRGMPHWLLPLLQAFWNHHPFQRGKRKGKSPLALAGIEDSRSWSEVVASWLRCPVASPVAA